MTSLAVSGDDKFVSFADKFGVVYVVDIGHYDEDNLAPIKKGVPILSHYCSIITRLVCHFVFGLFVSLYVLHLMVLVISDFLCSNTLVYVLFIPSVELL